MVHSAIGDIIIESMALWVQVQGTQTIRKLELCIEERESLQTKLLTLYITS